MTSKAVIASSLIFSHWVPPVTIAYDRRTGDTLWRKPAKQLHAEYRYVNGTYVGTGAHPTQLTSGTPAVYGGCVYTRTDWGNEVLDVETGELVGVHTSELPPAFSGPRAFFVQDLTYGRSLWGHGAQASYKALEARDRLTSALLWTFVGNDDIETAPVVAGDYVFVAGGGTVYGVHIPTGAALWQARLPWPVFRIDERNDDNPLIGLAAADHALYVPAGPYLVAFGR